MLTRSAKKKMKKMKKRNKKGEKKRSGQTQQLEGNKNTTEEPKKTENEALHVITAKELVLSSLSELNQSSESQLDVRSLEMSDKTVIMDQEGVESKPLVLPLVNLYVNAPLTKGDNPSVSQRVKPTIPAESNGSDRRHETASTSCQTSVIKRTAQGFVSVSKELRSAPIDLNETSDLVRLLKENNLISTSSTDKQPKNKTDVDVPDLNGTSHNEKRSQRLKKKGTGKKGPAIQVGNVKEQKIKRARANLDKDFMSVTPKLQNKLLSLIKKQIVKVNTSSYKNAKKKIIYSNYKHLIKYHKKRWNFIRSHISTFKESEQGSKQVKPGGVSANPIPEVIIISDSDTPIEKSNEEEEIKSKKKIKGEQKALGIKKRKDVDSNKKVPVKMGTRKNKERKVTLMKRNIVRGVELRERTIRKPVKEHLNWVKKVAFAKACQLQPKVFTEKEILVNPQGNRRKRNYKESDEDDSQSSISSPQRPKICYKNKKKCSTVEVSDMESSQEVPGSSSQEQANVDQVSASELEKNEGSCDSREAQLGSRLKPSPDYSNDEELQDDNLASSETSERLSDAYQLQPVVFAEKEILNGSPININQAQEIECKFESDDRLDEEVENDNQVSGATSERVYDAGQSQTTVLAEKKNLNDSLVVLKQTEEVRKKWLISLESYEKKRECQQKDNMLWLETPTKFSTCQYEAKRLPLKITNRKYNPQAPTSVNEKEETIDKASVSENERNGEICSTPVIPNKEKNLESNGDGICVALLAQSYTFSEIVWKFREKYYKDKVKIFFPNRNQTTNDQFAETPRNVVKDSQIKEEPESKSLAVDVSNVQAVRRKKEKVKSDRFKSDSKADENLNPSLSLLEPVKCLSSLAEKPLQRSHALAIPQEKESLHETSTSAIRTPFIPMLNNIQSNNENSLHCDGNYVPVSEHFEKVSDGIGGMESFDNSSLTGNETTLEMNAILQEGNHETDDEVNKIRDFKKKFGLLPGNIPGNNSETNDVFESSASQLDNSRKILFNKCMAQNTSDIKQAEKTHFGHATKRKGSPHSSPDQSVSSSKKMMESNEKDENSNKSKSSNKKVFTGEDYIPLNASGPTRFAVSPLYKVTPYRDHAAKDFKGNMLYGNRVKRFESPKSLDIYKSKQKASGKKSSFY